MVDSININQALSLGRSVTLASGKEISIFPLKLKDWQNCLMYHARFIETMQLMNADTLVTDEMVKDEMPWILVELFATGGADAVVEFVNFFTPEKITEADLTETEDFEKLWKAIYEDNKRPFQLKFQQMKRAGHLTKLKEVNLETLISSVSSTEQELGLMNSIESPSITP